jgi:deoxycytidylate deaminase
MENGGIDNRLLKANSANRVRSRDMFMLMALWMELYPSNPTKTQTSVRPTGCVLVDQRDRILSLQHTGESHSIVRAILSSPIDPQGCDIYVSRFPCSMCMKMMVQAGIRKVYYFPAKDWEVDWKAHCVQQEQGRAVSPSKVSVPLHERIKNKMEGNLNSVQRLIANNPIAMSKYIPIWNDGGDAREFTEMPIFWELDDQDKLVVNKHYNYPDFSLKFESTMRALSMLKDRYTQIPKRKQGDEDLGDPRIFQHAIVLAHIAAKRTDDPKVGVGAVIILQDGTYASVGWNGFPKKADVLDYPQAGADDFIEHELKYDYILHAGIFLLTQNKTLCFGGLDLASHYKAVQLSVLKCLAMNVLLFCTTVGSVGLLQIHKLRNQWMILHDYEV